jgi:hypothetical protein
MSGGIPLFPPQAFTESRGINLLYLQIKLIDSFVSCVHIRAFKNSGMEKREPKKVDTKRKMEKKTHRGASFSVILHKILENMNRKRSRKLQPIWV